MNKSKDVQVNYYLHTSSNEAVKLSINESYRIEQKYPVKILIHGWLDDKTSYWYEPTVSEYIKKGGVTVITVSWGKYSKSLYTIAVKNVKAVGEHIGKFVVDLSEKYGIPHEHVHLIGHSLGAHISGYAGKWIFNAKNRKIGRITGLDPARPRFENNSLDDRLHSGDAMFVDVIHSNAGVCGFAKSIGHVDFYPNGGSKQNGCTAGDLGGSHKRAPLYFAESINSDDFVAVRARSFEEFDCGRCINNQRAIMGENIETSIKGDFYLHTNKESPFARGPV